MGKRIFVIVLDSFGIGELPDAGEYGDEGSNTLAAVCKSEKLHVPHLTGLGLFSIPGTGVERPGSEPIGCFGRMAEGSKGKDTTIGHWELAGIISEKPMPTYPGGFPPQVLNQLTDRTGRSILCNAPYSGTQVIADYGQQHMDTGALIVYTSADSVLQIAAHEEIIPLEEQYRICETAREIMTGVHGVGRIIARPFLGEAPHFQRTANRRDFSLEPPSTTMLDVLKGAGLDVIGVGKIHDIFAGRGLTRTIKTKSNHQGMEKTLELAEESFTGLCFVNLVDFDMVYGHRNDVDGYAGALAAFDEQLGQLLPKLGEGDLLLITADHGCDPSTPSTDHSREYVPLLAWGPRIRSGVDLGTRPTFADLAATVQEYWKIDPATQGTSFLADML